LNHPARDAASPLVEVYIWFEADPADDARVVAAFARLAEAMVRGSAVAPAEAPRLLRRADLRPRPEGPRATWMEVWTAVPQHALAAWQDRLATSADDSGSTPLAHGGRHVEVFLPIPEHGGG
jgi:hypothetical protein